MSDDERSDLVTLSLDVLLEREDYVDGMSR